MEINWKAPESGWSWSILRHCPYVCLDRPKKTMENPSVEPITQQSEIHLTFLLSVWMKIWCGFKHCENANERIFLISSLYIKKASFTKEKDLYICDWRNKVIRSYVLKTEPNHLYREWNCLVKVLKVIQSARITQTFQKFRRHFKIL